MAYDPFDTYIATHMPVLEAAMRCAVSDVMTEQPANPLLRLIEMLQSDVPPHQSIAGIQKQLAQLVVQLMAQSPNERANGVAELQACVVAAQDVVDQLRAGINEVVEVAPPTSRSGHLRTLEELIGPSPRHSWKDEWDAMITEKDGSDYDRDTGGVEVRVAQGLDPNSWIHEHIEEVRTFGWPRESAEQWRLLTLGRAPCARALRERDSCYAASTHALCEVIFTQRQRQVREGAQAIVPHAFYRHLDDPKGASQANSLVMDEPAWAGIETPDATGFCGLTCSSALLVDSSPECFAEGGFCPTPEEEKQKPAADADVVMFESSPDDALGVHSPVLTGGHYATFPPNTLFRLKRVEAAGTWEAPGGSGLRPRQRLLVVSATYQKPNEATTRDTHGGKLCESVVTLQYGSRDHFVRGLDDILARPSLSMAHEFGRDSTWVDWRGITYSLRCEWAYVTGPASTTAGCTPGTRDANNEGKTPQQFQDEVNVLIRRRRAEGHGVALGEQDAFFTLDEVLAVRLYSGPSYQPINAFLRAVATLRGDFRTSLAAHAGLTFAATVRCIIQAIRKLAAITTPEEACQPLWRGVRGELPPSFWLPDKAGMVAAVDMAFMSTSRQRQTPIGYMGEGENVLWALRAQAESDAGYHRGADM
jgi:hypothetical protein